MREIASPKAQTLPRTAMMDWITSNPMVASLKFPFAWLRVCRRCLLAMVFWSGSFAAGAAERPGDAASPTLKIAVVQLALAPTLASSRDRIIGQLTDAARRGARVVVFPEAALSGKDAKEPEVVE